MPEEIQAMIDYSGALGAFLSISEVHFCKSADAENGNVPAAILIENKGGVHRG